MALWLFSILAELLAYSKSEHPNTGYFKSWKRALLMFTCLFIGIPLLFVWTVGGAVVDDIPWLYVFIGIGVYFVLYWIFLGLHSFDFLVQSEGIWVINRVWGFRSKRFISRQTIKQITFVEDNEAKRPPFWFLFLSHPSSVLLHFHNDARPQRIWCIGLEHDCFDENNCLPLYEDLYHYLGQLGYPVVGAGYYAQYVSASTATLKAQSNEFSISKNDNKPPPPAASVQ